MALLTRLAARGVPKGGLRTARSRLSLAIVAALGIWLAGQDTALAAGPSLEYAVKATYLYKFGPFVEWPPKVFASPQSSFNVCVFGVDPFGSALDRAVQGQTVAGHPVAVRRLQVVATNPDCHVLYIGRSDAQKPAQILELLRGAPVLTVTDEAQGISGGVVHFVLRDGRVRFGLDAPSAQANGLTISSKLLGLAIALQKAGG